MPAVFGSRLYGWHGGANAVRLSTFDAATGDLLYSTPILGSFLAETPPFVGPDGTVYAPKASPAGELIAFRDTGTTFVEKWRTSIGDVPYGSYAVGPDGSVYGYSQEYRIIRIRPSDGMILNTSEPSFYPYGVPRMAIDSAGLVFLVCDDQGIPSQGGLYSFNPDLTLRWKESIPRLRGLAIGQAGTLVVGGSETNVIAYRGDSEGLPGPPVKFYREGDGLFIIFSGRLQETDQLPGAWSDVPAANSPWLIAPINPRRFYRSIQE